MGHPWSSRASWITLSLALLLRGTAHAGEEAAPAVTFLDGDKGKDAIVDESVEPYFSLLQPMEMATKTGQLLKAKDLARQREECRKRYRDAIRDFTAEEKDALTALVGRIHAAWADEYPLFTETPWSFLKVAFPIEGGMPHTRGGSIVLPETVIPFLVHAAGATTDAGLAMPVELLVHEQSHVVQRLHPEVFEGLYTGPWGFERAKGLDDGAWLLGRQVVNPDGVDTGWVFPVKEGEKTAYAQPFLILSDGREPRRMPRDFRVIAVSVGKEGAAFRVQAGADGQPSFRPLDAVPEYMERFGAVDEIFHPNETFACFFSSMVVRDHFGGAGLSASSELVGPDFAALRAWCREHFGAKAPAGK